MTKKEKPRSGVAGVSGVSGQRSVKYMVVVAITVILLSGNALDKWSKSPIIQPPNIQPAAAGAAYPSSSQYQETETGIAPKPRAQTRPVPAGPAAPLVYRVPLNQQAVFITIDDGWVPSQGVLSLMRQYNLPVTAFLIQEAAAENVAYWQEFLKAGGQIEDHTYSHPFLTRIPERQDLAQIASPINYFKDMGFAPDELRPPYGDVDLAVQKLAARSGIKYVVMWDAVMSGGKLITIHNRPLAPGDIVLLHWVPGLDSDSVSLIHTLQQQNLGVASLSDALDGRPVHIAWLNEKTGVQTQPPGATSTAVYGQWAFHQGVLSNW